MTPEEVRAGNIGCDLLLSAIGSLPPEDENVQIEKEERTFLTALGLIALVGAVLIVVASLLPLTWLLRRALVFSFGEALLVAAILGFTVDKYIKGFLVRKASNELLKYLVGYKLPEPIQNRLRDLMGTPLIREHYQVFYTITPIADNQIVLDVRYQFDLKNITTSTYQAAEKRSLTCKFFSPMALRCVLSLFSR